MAGREKNDGTDILGEVAECVRNERTTNVQRMGVIIANDNTSRRKSWCGGPIHPREGREERVWTLLGPSEVGSVGQGVG